MLLLAILGYCMLFHFKLFLAIIKNYNIWLLMIIILMAIGGY